MPEMPMRRLAAIMFTDMVGYSALVDRDEALALELLAEHDVLLREAFGAHRGSVVKSLGDGSFVEFPSAYDACQCAVDIQSRIRERDREVPAERRFQVRIGIHVGDVVSRDSDLYGDGVNIAARIEPLAEAGGIAVSEEVARLIENKLGLELDDLGIHPLKNITANIRLFRLVLPWQPTPKARRSFDWAAWQKRARLWGTRLSPIALLLLGQFLYTHPLRGPATPLAAATPVQGWGGPGGPGPMGGPGGPGAMGGPGGQQGGPALPPGRLAFASNRTGRYQLYLLPLDIGSPQRLTTSDADDERPAWSPDARLIAFQRTEQPGVTDVWSIAADGGQPRRLTDHRGWYGEPVWSPDGRQLALIVKRDGHRQLSVMAADGSGLTALAPGRGDDFLPAWDRQSGQLAFLSTRDGQRRVWLIDPSRSGQVPKPLPVTVADGEANLAWRLEDGSLAVCDRTGIRVFNANGVSLSGTTLAASQPQSVSWTPRAHYAYAAPVNGHLNLFVNRNGLSASEAVQLTRDAADDKDPVFDAPLMPPGGGPPGGPQGGGSGFPGGPPEMGGRPGGGGFAGGGPPGMGGPPGGPPGRG